VKPNRSNPLLLHEDLLTRGVDLHEARQYAKALPVLRKAHDAWPTCPFVTYNIANTLHMLDRDEEGYCLLRGLSRMSVKSLAAGCPINSPRALLADVNYLLFVVLIHLRGPTAQAFRYAKKHLASRKRGLPSLWSIREVRSSVRLAMRCRSAMRKIVPLVL
jgi:hypothetical protein